MTLRLDINLRLECKSFLKPVKGSIFGYIAWCHITRASGIRTEVTIFILLFTVISVILFVVGSMNVSVVHQGVSIGMLSSSSVPARDVKSIRTEAILMMPGVIVSLLLCNNLVS